MTKGMIKNLWLALGTVVVATACSTSEKYTANPDAAVLPARDATYPIAIYSEGTPVPRKVQAIGLMNIGDKGLAVKGGTLAEEMDKLRKAAREKAADAVRVDVDDSPGFLSSQYRVSGVFLRFTDTWETIPKSEADFQAYLKDNAAKLDPIEGVWSCNDISQSRVAIMRDHSKPGRLFVGFILTTKNLAWKPGSKKLEITQKDPRAVYDLRLYQDDYVAKDAAVRVADRSVNQFEVVTSEMTSVDQGSSVVFTRD